MGKLAHKDGIVIVTMTLDDLFSVDLGLEAIPHQAALQRSIGQLGMAIARQYMPKRVNAESGPTLTECKGGQIIVTIYQNIDQVLPIPEVKQGEML